MWHPPEGIRHALPSARWPSADEASKGRWFTPVRLGPVELRARTWVPAMVPWRATEDGFVTDDVRDWYGRFARGRPGAIVVEATGIRDIPSGPLLRIGDDRFVSGLASLVETVRRESGGATRLFVQILDFLSIRRRPEKAKYFGRFLAITDAHRGAYPGLADDRIRDWLAAANEDEIARVLSTRELDDYRFGSRERVTDLHQPQIAELPRVLPGLFAAAARRASEAGFDGVELHYAHAYTMASFLSARNTRSDGFGGSREGRLRLPLETFRTVRAAVPASFAVGCRMLSEDAIEGGSTVEDASFFAVEFARAGMDFLSLSRGGKFEDAKQPSVGQAAYPYTGPSGYQCMPTVLSDAAGPYGRNVPFAAHVRRAVRQAGYKMPTVVTGGIATFEQAEAILSAGEADIVGSARQSLADPDWFEKVHTGRGDEIRRCSFTNYCEALDQLHKLVTCKLWDRLGRDAPGVKLTPDGKRRLVAP